MGAPPMIPRARAHRAAPAMTARPLRAATPRRRRRRRAAHRILRALAPAPAMTAVLQAAPRVIAPARALRAAAPVIPALAPAAAHLMTLRAPARAIAARPAAARRAIALPAAAPAIRAPRAAAAPATREGMAGYEEWDNTRLRRECAATETHISQGVAAEYIHFVNLYQFRLIKILIQESKILYHIPFAVRSTFIYDPTCF